MPWSFTLDHRKAYAPGLKMYIKTLVLDLCRALGVPDKKNWCKSKKAEKAVRNVKFVNHMPKQQA